MSLQEAPGPSSSKRQKILEPSVESLVAADSPPPPSSYEEKHDDHQQLQLMNQVSYLGNVENVCSNYSGFICQGDKLYIFGGEQLPDSTHFNNSAYCLHFPGISNDVKPLRDPSHKNEVHPSCKNEAILLQLPSMKMEKYIPIVAHIDGLIYVLSSGHVLDLIEPCFEVYDPRDSSWSVLPSPFPLIEICMGFESCSDFYFNSYLVVDRKLCVSTLGFSLAFDTKTCEWHACELFCGFSHPPDFQVMYEGAKPDPTEFASPPFSFIRQAILYEEDILICVVFTQKLHVVAYQIVDGKVEKLQVLLRIEDGGACENLVDLGGGYICYQYVTYSDESLSVCSCVKFVTFKVSKIDGGRAVRDGSDSEFLQCEHLNTLTQKIKAGFAYDSVYSFPLEVN